MVQHILLTGGNGYIGSHTALVLLQNGYKVTLFDNLCNSSPKCFKALQKLSGVTDDRLTLVLGDLLKEADVERLFTENGPFDAVIHFGALKSVGESVVKPLLYYNNNLGGTFTLLNAMNKHNCKVIVFSSSATVYGDAPVPLTEASPVGHGITNPYGQSKCMMEQILTDNYLADKTWGVILLRYFNPVGAHPSGEIGESPNGIPNNLVPYIQQVAVGRREYLRVYGDDYDTPDGTGVRDYIHVMDLADGHLKAIQYILDKLHGHGLDIINLGTGHGSSVLEVLHGMEEACGHKLAYKIEPRRPGDLATVYADTKKAKEVLGWEAKLTIKDMCRDAWNWQHKYPYGFDDAPEN
ncbi:hypothetical protein WA158_006683 [Blastocystis sp. Blastoise]